MERKKSGDPLQLFASEWNRIIAAVEDVESGRYDRSSPIRKHQRHNADILCRNTSGGALAAFSVVGLDATVTPTPSASLLEFKQQDAIVDCVTPQVPDHVGKWGITQEAMAANAVGRVRVAGITIAQLSGTPPDESDFGIDPFPYFAECEDANSSTLAVKHRGTAQVLWKDSGSAWAIIRIGNAWRPHAIRGTLTDGNTFEQETAADPHTLGSIIGIDCPWIGDSTVEVDNPMKIKLWNGCVATAHYNVTGERWEVIAAESDKVVHGIKREACTFYKLDGADGWDNWNGGGDEDAKWVTSVVVSATGCVISVEDSCDGWTDYELNFVTHVGISGNVLYYSRCDGDHIIANLGPCPEEYPCGYTDFEAQMVMGSLEWVQTATTCSGACSIVEPSSPPSFLGETTRVACEEP